MARVFAHPFRLDGSGNVSTVEQGSLLHAGQLAQAVVSTVTGERDLAPDFGIADPSGVGVSAEGIYAAMSICEPDVTVTDVEITGGNEQNVTVSVAWTQEA